MLTFFEKELVEKHKWITHEEFVESVALGQMTPGPPIINTGICIGYKLRKIKGALGNAGTGIHRNPPGDHPGYFLFQDKR